MLFIFKFSLIYVSAMPYRAVREDASHPELGTTQTVPAIPRALILERAAR
jgi:hypothetical protein